jgi:HupE/UreJ protein
MSCRLRAVLAALAFCAAAASAFLTSGPADAHGFSSVVYADISSSGPTSVRAKLGLEYDLMLVSVATSEKDDPFHAQGQPAWDDGDFPAMVQAVKDHRPALTKYVLDRFTISARGTPCTATMAAGVTVTMRNQVPYANVVFDFTCAEPSETDKGHVIRSTLFPDSEQFVTGTKTIVVYDLDGKSGSAALDSSHPSFSTEQTWYERFWEFFRLGANHLLTGTDHILFLVALIAGSRRLREVVLAATTFTLAHSVTFVLAALGVVHPPAGVVEPTIALSIAAVAAWHLWRLWRRGSHADDLETHSSSHFSLDRSGWFRLAIVFCFGLIHGLGFASALGIQRAFSWQLMWSLLVFNVGIEVVQLSIIVVAFPVLALLRRRNHTAWLWATGAIATAVSIMGLVWFAQRIAAG